MDNDSYVVHVFNNQSTRKFKLHKPAFQAFKMAARRNLIVALWYCDKKGKWTIVQSTGFYPTAMVQPPSRLYDSNKGVA